jgi:hypothetical protein
MTLFSQLRAWITTPTLGNAPLQSVPPGTRSIERVGVPLASPIQRRIREPPPCSRPCILAAATTRFSFVADTPFSPLAV